MSARRIAHRLNALFIRKTEADSILRYHLKEFVNPSRAGTEVRLWEYARLHKWLILSRQCSVRPRGLHLLFYTRFYTFHNLCSDYPGRSSPDLPERLTPLRSPRAFTECASRVIDGMSTEDDPYGRIVGDYLGDEQTTRLFLDRERELTGMIRTGTKNEIPFIRDKFSALNRETLEYARCELRSDINALATIGERLRDVYSEY